MSRPIKNVKIFKNNIFKRYYYRSHFSLPKYHSQNLKVIAYYKHFKYQFAHGILSKHTTLGYNYIHYEILVLELPGEKVLC